MVIFHFQANVIQRSKGRSAVAAAAYRAGIELMDERTGLSFDYSKKCGIGETFIIGWSGSRSELWNAAEAAEKRKDSTTAREYVVALPKELDPMDRQALARQLAELINDRYGVVVDVCLHGVDSVNPHAHLLTTTREMCPVYQELGRKSIVDISNADRKKRKDHKKKRLLVSSVYLRGNDGFTNGYADETVVWVYESCLWLSECADICTILVY